MINHKAKNLPDALDITAEELADAVNTVRSVAAKLAELDCYGVEELLWAMEKLRETPKLLLAATVAVNEMDLMKGVVQSSESTLPLLFTCYYLDNGCLSRLSLQVEALLKLPEEMLRSLALVTSLQYYRPVTRRR